MKKTGGGTVFKIFIWTAFLACCFLGACLLLAAVPFLPFDGDAEVQDTRQYRWLIWQRERQLTEGYALAAELRGGDLSYARAQEVKARAEALEKRMGADATNFRFRILDREGREVKSNLPGEEELPAPVFYADFREGEDGTMEDFWGNSSWESASDETSEPDTEAGAEEVPVYTIACSALAGEALGNSKVEDEFSRYSWWFTRGMEGRMVWAGFAAILLSVSLAFLGLILWSAGRKNGVEGIVLTWQEKIPFDVYVFGMACALCFTVTGAAVLSEPLVALSTWDAGAPDWREALELGCAGFCALTALGAALTLRTLAVRRKARALARSTLLCRVLIWFGRTVKACWQGGVELFRSLPFLWKEVLAFFMYFFLGLACLGLGFGGAFFWVLLNLIVFLFLCWWGIGFHRIQKGGYAIAGGDFDYQIDTHQMPRDLRRHAEDLNNISGGMASAVEEKMKSERFKAELITNVSHDLKTPLTSIINYVDLLKGTDQTDPKAAEYIEVLDRKSQRLKKLTEDLVEASKASTGVLSVNREKIGLSQLLEQALGEWREKLEERRLTLVTTLPEGETWVYADGRHLWRVLDNLLSNCAKYALEGTRVYLDLNRGKGQVALSVKNISREPLNVPPERLLERFVRGEESRTTEGSGLGLSIARSLMELQGGAFELVVDGDLFKAVVSLPQAN